jgi:CRP/FNR family transcriptional regulator, cyclic AMP receptor protein
LVLTASERTRMLAGVGLFSGASEDVRGAVAERLVEAEFRAGHRIARQGEIETGFLMIVTGAASVVRDGEVLAHLGPGDFFGELSLLDRQPRVASVTADEPTTCLALASWDFEDLLETQPGVALAVLREVARRLRAVETDHRS